VSKNGYNKLLSRFQELLSRFQELNADNLSLRSELMKRDRTILELQAATTAPAQDNEKPKTKLKELWTSTPVWGAGGLLLTLIISPWSVLLIYALIWGVFCFEFWRARVVENNALRRLLNVVFAALLLFVFVVSWPHLPKPKEEANLDAALNKFGDRLSDTIATREEATSKPRGAVQPVLPSAELHAPNFSIELHSVVQNESSNVATGDARNGPGADIENLVCDLEYFVAELHEDEPYSKVVFNRYNGPIRFNLFSAYSLQMPRNATIPIQIPIVTSAVNNVNQMAVLTKPEAGLRKFAGVRITVNYKRAADGKAFKYVVGYEFITNGGSTVQAIFSGARGHNPSVDGKILGIADVEKYIGDDSKWFDPVFKVTRDAAGNTSASVSKD
jgi:hypothetical protein